MLLSLAAVDPNALLKGATGGEGVKQLGAVAHHPNKKPPFSLLTGIRRVAQKIIPI